MPKPEEQLAPDPIENSAEPSGEGAAAPKSRGTPSPHLRAALESAGMPGSALDTSPNYERATDGAPERGIFQIVGGYLDDDGKIHKEVELRSISGEEEDLLGNRSVLILDRLNTMLANCTKRIGDITDPNQIRQAINRLPGGSRVHLLICLRRTSHWRKTKDIYDMTMECPRCHREDTYALDLSALDLYEMEDPTKRSFIVKLPDTEQEVEWRVATSQQEYVMSLVADVAESEYLTFMIMVRLVSVDDQDMRLGISDLLTDDRKHLRMSQKAKTVRAWAKKLPSSDRDELREQFMRHEPGVDIDLEFKCPNPKCGKPYAATIDVAQESFFFPSATYKRSKRRRS